jgi:hypothetical protein
MGFLNWIRFWWVVIFLARYNLFSAIGRRPRISFVYLQAELLFRRRSKQHTLVILSFSNEFVTSIPFQIAYIPAWKVISKIFPIIFWWIRPQSFITNVFPRKSSHLFINNMLFDFVLKPPISINLVFVVVAISLLVICLIIRERVYSTDFVISVMFLSLLARMAHPHNTNWVHILGMRWT